MPTSNMRIDRLIGVLLIFLLLAPAVHAQELDLLEEDSIVPVTFTRATFKTNRLVVGHSVEMVAKRDFDFKISHRFGFLNEGFYTMFGLDQASMRIGGDYGITDNLNVGLGRSTEEKTYDGFLKYRMLRQSNKMPLTAVLIGHVGINTLKNIGIPDPSLVQRMHYTTQLLLARKFNRSFSLQLSPTMVHMNVVDSAEHDNDLYFLGVGARQKLTNRITFNAEYFLPLSGNRPEDRTDALSIGFDIETGGHVFQIFFTNTFAAYEKGFLTDSKASWADGDVRYGFNIARMFSF